MTDLSSQIGYIIYGGQLLDLNDALGEVSNETHRTSVGNVVKNLQTTAQDFQNSSEYLSLVKDSTCSQSQESDARATTTRKVNTRESILNSLPDATNKTSNSISDTRTASNRKRNTTTSTNPTIITEATTHNNYEPVFFSDVIVLGKMILAIRKPACEESHQDVVKATRAAAAKDRVSFTDGAVLSRNSTSNAYSSITSSIPATNSSPLVAQNDAKPNNSSEKNSDSNAFGTCNPLPFSELRLSDYSQSLNPLTNSFNSDRSSPSDFSGSLVKVFDASGCYVIPGFIDCHMHAYQYSTPLGIKVDECCLQRGVTTAIDAGSAGIEIHWKRKAV